MRVVATIGVYGWTLDTFLDTLRRTRVGLLLDVRQRRGVRGTEYAWANAVRLEAALASAGIPYRHVKELAPTTELRKLQYAEDATRGVGKRSRDALAPAYRRRYVAEVLDHVDVADLVLGSGAACVALLCVERHPHACHRSLVAERLDREHSVEVIHLLPEP